MTTARVLEIKMTVLRTKKKRATRRQRREVSTKCSGDIGRHGTNTRRAQHSSMRPRASVLEDVVAEAQAALEVVLEQKLRHHLPLEHASNFQPTPSTPRTQLAC